MKVRYVGALVALGLLTFAADPSLVYAAEHDNASSVVAETDQTQTMAVLEQKESQLLQLKAQNLSPKDSENVDKLLTIVNDMINQEAESNSPYGTRSLEIPGLSGVSALTSIPDRLELITEIIESIYKTTNNLTTKVRDAHAEMGFEITKAVIVVGNPNASASRIADEIAKLQATYDKVSHYKDLSDNDYATLYVKSKLEKAIWQTRFTRDKKILGKGKFEVYNNLNKQITKAVGVWTRAKSTVAEVNQAVIDLNNALQEALAQMPDETTEKE